MGPEHARLRAKWHAARRGPLYSRRDASKGGNANLRIALSPDGGFTLAVVTGTPGTGARHRRRPALVAAACAAVLAAACGGRALAHLPLGSHSVPAGGTVPRAFTCDGADVSPELHWGTPPPGTRSLALVMSDPDAPGGTFHHWIVYNLPPAVRELPAGAAERPGALHGAAEGRNDFPQGARGAGVGYGGPCPPPGPPHRYVWTVYALDARLHLRPGATAPAVLAALRGHVLATWTLTARYGRG